MYIYEQILCTNVMKRIIVTTLVSLALFAGINAQTYSNLYEKLPIDIKQVAPVEFPDNKVELTDFGAVGDGVTLCTQAFEKAISKLNKLGGGHLIVPKGVWLTGPIALKDNIDLHLEKNAIIMFSSDKSLYIDDDDNAKRVNACIRASKRKNIGITGEGLIDGNGAQWRPVKRVKVSDVEWKRFEAMGGVTRDNGELWYPWDMKSGYPNIADEPVKQEGMRNDLVRFTNCENVLFEGVTFQNAPKFHVHPCNCLNVIADGITIRCPWNAQNGDGLDFSDCSVGLIKDCTIDVGDDGICMKSGEDKGTKALVNGVSDILIVDNTVYHAHGGFVVGSEAVTAMRNIVVRDCKFLGTDVGLRFKSGIGRGGKTENIFIKDIFMADITDQAIVVQCDYQNLQAGTKAQKFVLPKNPKNVPEFTDIHIENVVCHRAKTAIKMVGINTLNCIHDIEIKNSTIVYTKEGNKIDSETAQNIVIDNVKLIEDKK